MAYSNAALRQLKDTAEYEESTPVLNTDTAESEDVWASVTANEYRCRYSDRSTREIPTHKADLELKRLIVPGSLLINGSEPDKASHRIAQITRASGKVLTGPFKIVEVLDREDMKGNLRLMTFIVERVK